MRNPVHVPKDILDLKLVNLEISLSCFEIYNDEIHDLFQKKGMKQRNSRLQIKDQ